MTTLFKSSHAINSTSRNFKFKKLQNISNVFQNKIYFLNIKSTLNNFYITITNNFGKILLVSSGGSSTTYSSKRNTNYNLELLLLDFLKKLSVLNIKILILRLDLSSIKKKKVIVKVLNQNQIKVLGVQLNMSKAFNGVRACKRRRI